jgi:hypothetical protein
VRLLAEMARECALREIPFVVVQLPDGGRGMARGVLERAVGAANVIDLESRLDYETLHYRHDIHLTEHGHREVADALLPELDRRMRKRP